MWRLVKKGVKEVKGECKKGARTVAEKVFPRGPNLSRRSVKNAPLGKWIQFVFC
jgi:hypothetical protein